MAVGVGDWGDGGAGTPARIQECLAVPVIKRAERMTDPCGGIRRTAHDLSRIWFRCRSGLLYDSDTH